ncbi:MAG: GNAT family N-acetyltransferase, partial [Bacteriovoracaceae bacterium]|nr:GNAT family N-acetyltransferase [Bacteriovoracaceae bacterium]
PVYFLAIVDDIVVGMLPTYIKSDSFGEFIFDWAWADLYQRNNLPYYPKLVCALPFSPVNVSKLLVTKPEYKEALLNAYDGFLKQNKALSSSHFLFATGDEAKYLNNHGHFTRKSIQYHFTVEQNNFEDFLQTLKARKRKQVKKERQFIKDSNLEIKVLESLTDDEVSKVYELYLTTIDKKYSQAYLNEDFFKLMQAYMSENTVVIAAYREGVMIAMSYFLKSDSTLYGRYWGVSPHEEIQYLHFELCYYQGIEYCMKHNLSLFEAGAQGEQKLLRGFRPVEILSAHKLTLEPVHEAIEHHVKTENAYICEQLKELKSYLPFKEDV